MIAVTVTPAQAALVQQAHAALVQAQQQLTTLVSILSAGHVPPGATWTGVSETTLTFAEIQDADA